jgi:hypothetical protein
MNDSNHPLYRENPVRPIRGRKGKILVAFFGLFSVFVAAQFDSPML